jgi:hypothetical protein
MTGFFKCKLIIEAKEPILSAYDGSEYRQEKTKVDPLSWLNRSQV